MTDATVSKSETLRPTKTAGRPEEGAWIRTAGLDVLSSAPTPSLVLGS